jgi:cytochrome c oxidase assembly factor CtaG
MSPTVDAFLRSWSFDAWLFWPLLATGAIYLRGWLALDRRDPAQWHGGRLAAFCGGLAVTYVALASPIEPFASLLLQMHMVQHLLLLLVVPPLVWLGAPLFPLLRGLPREVRSYWVGPLLRGHRVRAFFSTLAHPLVAWPSFVAATWWWHVPVNYELALDRTGWHVAEHACFLGAGLLFWYPVVRPYTGPPRWSEWGFFT